MKLERLICASALAALTALLLSGCAPSSDPQPLPADEHPHIVTDLNSLSADQVDSFKHSTPKSTLLAKVEDPNTAHVYQQAPGLQRQVGSDADPTVEILLNDKAAQYANFSQGLMDRIYSQLRVLEREDEIAKTKIPTEIKPTVITAIMDKQGNLQELILEQHSGKALLDKLAIKACKKALWYPSGPSGALTEDGNYKLTIQIRLENFSSKDGRWQFKTEIALGIA